ncbi:hypothetical protein EMIHUDRAFT_440112, partial [Emiliania huxleyi CCMP1516]|uniref:Uncharacterized protein n=2 Tax=Emiliania huxleyi TaxID=2903 RepID=A0A0D3KRU2_EMIH1
VAALLARRGVGAGVAALPSRKGADAAPPRPSLLRGAALRGTRLCRGAAGARTRAVAPLPRRQRRRARRLGAARHALLPRDGGRGGGALWRAGGGRPSGGARARRSHGGRRRPAHARPRHAALRRLLRGGRGEGASRVGRLRGRRGPSHAPHRARRRRKEPR